MGILVMTAVLAGTHTFTYDGEVLPNRARPPWSFREIDNCSAATGEAWWDYVTWSAEQPEVEVYLRAQHHIVFKQEGVYTCFPSLHQYEDGTLVSAFGTRVRWSHIDNTGGSGRMVSRDGGIRWEKADAAVPYYNPATVRADGHLAIANAIGWRYVDEGETERLKAEGRTVRTVRPGTIAYLSGARSMVRSISGETVRPWTEIEVPRGGGMMAFHQAAYLNLDGGKSWDVEDEIILRADGFGSGSDLGYPITQRLVDGTLATIYYFNSVDNITHICLTRWTPPEK